MPRIEELREMNVDITKDEAYSIAEFIDNNLISYIKEDPDLDSMEWLINVVTAYQRLCLYSGYKGTTDETWRATVDLKKELDLE